MFSKKIVTGYVFIVTCHDIVYALLLCIQSKIYKPLTSKFMSNNFNSDHVIKKRKEQKNQ